MMHAHDGCRSDAQALATDIGEEVSALHRMLDAATAEALALKAAQLDLTRERLAYYLDQAKREEILRSGDEPYEPWWLGLAETLREAQADRERLETLEAETRERHAECFKAVWVAVGDGGCIEIDLTLSGDTIFEALDALRAAQKECGGE